MKRLVRWLKQQTSDPRQSLRRFTQGGLGFAIGMMVIILVEQLMPAGIMQEICALFGLLLTIAGGLRALWGYLSLSLFKLLLYILDQDSRER